MVSLYCMFTNRKQSFGSFLMMETLLNKVREELHGYKERIKVLERELNALEVEYSNDAVEH